MSNSKIFLYKKELNYLVNRRIFRKPETILLSFWQDLDEIHLRLGSIIQKVVDKKRSKLAKCAQRIGKRDVLKKLSMHKMIIENVFFKVSSNFKKNIAVKENKLKLMLKSLQDRSPVSILGRGFAIVYKADRDKALKGIDEAKVGSNIRVILKDGLLLSKVLSKYYKRMGMKYENGD